mgnify:CR=1 FL=1
MGLEVDVGHKSKIGYGFYKCFCRIRLINSLAFLMGMLRNALGRLRKTLERKVREISTRDYTPPHVQEKSVEVVYPENPEPELVEGVQTPAKPADTGISLDDVVNVNVRRTADGEIERFDPTKVYLPNYFSSGDQLHFRVHRPSEEAIEKTYNIKGNRRAKLPALELGTITSIEADPTNNDARLIHVTFPFPGIDHKNYKTTFIVYVKPA